MDMTKYITMSSGYFVGDFLILRFVARNGWYALASFRRASKDCLEKGPSGEAWEELQYKHCLWMASIGNLVVVAVTAEMVILERK